MSAWRKALAAAAAGAAFFSSAALALDAAAQAAMEAAGAPDAARRIEADTRYLAHDRLAGREAGSAGYKAAADYVAARLAALGVAPGADGKWLQTVTLRAAVRNPDAAMFIVQYTDGVHEPLIAAEDYIIGQARAAAAFDEEAPAVFVGYGVVDPEGGHNDYEGVDVAGKIVIAFAGGPVAADSERGAVLASWSQKLTNAASRGAVGFISLPTIAEEQRVPWPRATASMDKAAMTWVGPDGAVHMDAPEIGATARLSASGAEKVFKGAPVSFEALRRRQHEGSEIQSFDLPVRIRLGGASELTQTQSWNVVGMIEGSDPRLRDEVVVLSAHLDHIGVKQNAAAGDDAINNGALDNAVGVATIIEAARRFSETAPPKRTLVFLATTAEEKGLIGADYFARHPTIGEKRIVANVNLDMPLVLYPFTDVIAFGAERSTLGEMVRRAASSMGVALSPDPMPEERLFTRSDHYSFVEQGVPSVFLVTGFADGGGEIFKDFLRTHYHKPSDEIDLAIDYEAAARFAELNYLIAREITDAPQAPRWRPGDFFGERFGR